jgi:CheY-specific phosphatase CheX
MSALRGTPVQMVKDLYSQVCSELLAAFGLTATIEEASGHEPCVAESGMCSLLGATGDGIKLLSSLQADRQLLAVLHPAGSDKVSRQELEDCCGEINNQLVGRLKNKLLGYGCEVALGLPTLVTGDNLSAAAPGKSNISHYRCKTKAGSMNLMLATLVAPEFDLREVPVAADGESVMREGEISLF